MKESSSLSIRTFVSVQSITEGNVEYEYEWISPLIGLKSPSSSDTFPVSVVKFWDENLQFLILFYPFFIYKWCYFCLLNSFEGSENPDDVKTFILSTKVTEQTNKPNNRKFIHISKLTDNKSIKLMLLKDRRELKRNI